MKLSEYLPYVREYLPYISLILAITSALFTMSVWKVSRKTLKKQNVRDLISHYRSTEMALAIRRIWELYRTNNDTFIEKYFEIDGLEMKKLNSLAGYNKKNYLESTIYFQRRLIVNFYIDVANAYQNKLIDKKDLFLNWTKEDLEIIPKILKPLENERRKRNFGEKTELHINEEHPLVKLYEARNKYK
ncbi:hypothetical protein KFE98_14890 [bacterium SCSIO 12741]|nr:hypothetical protein KFE98_14890 [bacterium SCSIO 12741]